MQTGQPNVLAPNITGTSGGSRTTPASPTPSATNSAPDPRMSILSHPRQVPSRSQPGKISSLPEYHLDLAYSTRKPVLSDVWGPQLGTGNSQTSERDRAEDMEDQEKDVIRYFHRLEIESRPPSTLPVPLHPLSTASRSASASSSTKPPSLTTTTSSSSNVSSSSSVSTSASTSGTSENSEPPPLQHRRLSSSSHPVAAASLSKSPSLHHSRSRSNQQLSSLPHPHHPGPIALPPPPPVTAFPVGHAGPHSISPHGMMNASISPLHHPLGSPSSPLHYPHHQQPQYQPQYQQQIPSQVPNTPHGLPPITPSMPPFNFLPLATATNASGPSLSQIQPIMVATSRMQITVPKIHHAHPPPHHDEQRRHLPGINSFPFSQTPPATSNENNGKSNYTHAYTSGLASPGTMSPGAFWGRPGTSAVNPMINPAVGAPVHIHGGSPGVQHGPMHSPGYLGHLHSPGHGGMFYSGEMGQGMREPAGYFDPGYFPPMGGAGTGTSFVENEILKPKNRGEGNTVEAKMSGGNVVEGEGSAMPSPPEGQATLGADDGDLRVWEGREGKVMDDVVVDVSTQGPNATVISRAHSMSSSMHHPHTVHRSGSEPTTTHSHTVEDRGKEPKLLADDAVLVNQHS